MIKEIRKKTLVEKIKGKMSFFFQQLSRKIILKKLKYYRKF